MVDGYYLEQSTAMSTEITNWEENIYYLLEVQPPTLDCQQDCYPRLLKSVPLNKPDDLLLYQLATLESLPSKLVLSTDNSSLTFSFDQPYSLNKKITKDRTENTETLSCDNIVITLPEASNYPILTATEWTKNINKQAVRYFYDLEQVQTFFDEKKSSGFYLDLINFSSEDEEGVGCQFSSNVVEMVWVDEQGLTFWQQSAELTSKRRQTTKVGLGVAFASIGAAAGIVALAKLAISIDDIIKAKKMNSVPDLDFDNAQLITTLQGFLPDDWQQKSSQLAEKLKSINDIGDPDLDEAISKLKANPSTETFAVVVNKFNDVDEFEVDNRLQHFLLKDALDRLDIDADKVKLSNLMAKVEQVRTDSPGDARLVDLDTDEGYTKARVKFEAGLLIDNIKKAKNTLRERIVTIIPRQGLTEENKNALKNVLEGEGNVRLSLFAALKKLSPEEKIAINNNLEDGEAKKTVFTAYGHRYTN